MSQQPYKPPIEETLAELEALSRSPFRRLLARIMDCAPSPEAIQALAEKNPDRWGQLMAIVGRTSGYNEKLELEGTLTQRLTDQSDSQLLARITALESALVDSQSNALMIEEKLNQ